MTHQFDVDIAAEYGVNVAILFNNFAFWIAKNKANGNNYRNGTYWTHNSIKAFQELFPYMSKKQIENAIKKMLDENLLIKDNFNENKHDRTLWYALTEKAFCILQNRRMDLPKKGNGVSPEGKCINTDSYPNNNPDVNTDREEATSRFTPPTAREVHDYCQEKGYRINEEKFISFYESIGWKVGKNKMKDWKAAVRTWVQRDKEYNKQSKQEQGNDDVYLEDYFKDVTVPMD